MNDSSFTVADYLLTRLQQLGVTDIFQIPSDTVRNFSRALADFAGINSIGAINEMDAAYAADAYGRTRGLGAVSFQYGVSEFSALNAIAGAYIERSPVVVISASEGADRRQQTNMYGMVFNHATGVLHADQSVYSNITVATATLYSPAGAEEKIDDLLNAALTHSRPVYIACSEEVWLQQCQAPSPVPLQTLELHSDELALENAVEFAWSQITAASNPLILVGVELLRFGLTDLLQKIIDASGVLYTTTILGKTVLDENGEKFIGTYSDRASVRSVMETVAASDCIISLGTILTDDYLWLMENKYAQMIHASTDQMRVGYGKYENVTLRDFMSGLLVYFSKSKKYPLPMVAPALPVHPEPWLSNMDPQWVDKPDVLTYNRFFQHLMKYFTDKNMLDSIVMVLGISNSLYVAANATGMKQGSFIGSAAWQRLGFETGATSGAQLGSGKRAWTIAGDGGFMMVCQSLATLARNKLNSVIFVMSNSVYAIEHVQAAAHFREGQQQNPDAYDILPKWDYMALAQTFGAIGFRASTTAALDEILLGLEKIRDQPVLVEVMIPVKCMPRQVARMSNDYLPFWNL